MGRSVIFGRAPPDEVTGFWLVFNERDDSMRKQFLRFEGASSFCCWSVDLAIAIREAGDQTHVENIF